MSNVIDKIRLSGTDYTLSATSSGVSFVEVTQAQYDALPSSAKTDTSKMYVITDAEAGDLSQYWTSAQTNSAITQAVSGKQDTLVSGTNIKTINNESLLGSGNIDIQGGGGKAVSGGTNISITTGETADTINCTLPISADTKSITINKKNIRFGNSTTSNLDRVQFAFGDSCSASGIYSMAMGYLSQASNYSTFAYGYRALANNQYQTSFGRNPLSNVGSSTFGDSGNTLFCIGNATSDTDNARHNAFEIRQNGDIYCSDGTNDVKLQDTISATAANTTALGGLKLVKLTQAQYDALATKDSNTLYVIVN